MDKELIDRLRKELIDVVDELADPNFPSKNWGSSKQHPGQGARWPGYIDYFVIDNPFSSAPEYNIGLRLKNREAADAVCKLASALADLSKKVGYHAEPPDVLSRKEWPNIVLLAQQAKDALSK